MKVDITAKKREIIRREHLILDIASRLLIKGGYHGLTMAQIANKANCSKGTVYKHYKCKEDIIVALATESVDKQRALIERAVTFQGRPRERMLAVGEATHLFSQLYKEDSRIFQIMNGEAITQKSSELFLSRMRTSANITLGVMTSIVRDAILQGDLTLSPEMPPEDIIYHFWLIGESGKAASTNWMPPPISG